MRLAALALFAVAPFFASAQAALPTAPSFVGSAACESCHQKQYQAWKRSDHRAAMQEAGESTVLGNFKGARLASTGATATFFKRDGKFLVNTDGPDGKLRDYEVRYTFGVEPLQQYLIAMPGGRLQALGIAWDTRGKETGGQRWFHLYSKEHPAPGNPLHWTGIDQNWNYQCAECHSTGLRKRFDDKTETYDTQWSEMSVGCEACHGPGSAHVAWAGDKMKRVAGANNGLAIHFTERRDVAWTMDAASGIARRSSPRASNIEVDACGRCHSRRGVLTDDYVYGKPLLDTHLPALLSDGLYYADGQIQGEVYEYGSFLQSKMHAAGVTCSDCHEPHSTALRADSNKVCAQCHLPEKFATSAHHHHKAESRGGDCLACHMASRTYMEVDPRRDHSFRIPRPDLSAAIGTPNACNSCHADKSNKWAANAFSKWYKPASSVQARYADALHAARNGDAGAQAKLVGVAEDRSIPAIARASALAELGRIIGPAARPAVQQGLRDPDPLVRVAALRALDNVDPRGHVKDSAPLLNDPVLGVRITAASLLAGVSRDALTPLQGAAREQAIAEYVAAQQINADRPEAQLNLGLLYTRTGSFALAETHYRKALSLQPSFGPAYVNLADAYRVQGRDSDGEKILRDGTRQVPADANIAHALALTLVREQKLDEALVWLKVAAERSPENARFAYAYGLALHSSGQTNKALTVLTDAQRRHPHDLELLYALATMSRDAGRMAAARKYAQQLAAAAPDDLAAANLLTQLGRP